MEFKEMITQLALVWPELKELTREDLAIRFARKNNKRIDKEIESLEAQKTTPQELEEGIMGMIRFLNK